MASLVNQLIYNQIFLKQIEFQELDFEKQLVNLSDVDLSIKAIPIESKKIKKDEKTCSSETAMCYVCKTPSIPGKLMIQKCLNEGVPKGPLLGQLKKGLDVILPCGKIVRYVHI